MYQTEGYDSFIVSYYVSVDVEQTLSNASNYTKLSTFRGVLYEVSTHYNYIALVFSQNWPIFIFSNQTYYLDHLDEIFQNMMSNLKSDTPIKRY